MPHVFFEARRSKSCLALPRCENTLLSSFILKLKSKNLGDWDKALVEHFKFFSENFDENVHSSFAENMSEKLWIFSPLFGFQGENFETSQKCCKSFKFFNCFFSEKKCEKQWSFFIKFFTEKLEMFDVSTYFYFPRVILTEILIFAQDLNLSRVLPLLLS
jgi:hypothetical protein